MYKRKRMVNVLLRFGMISSSTAIAVPLPHRGRKRFTIASSLRYPREERTSFKPY